MKKRILILLLITACSTFAKAQMGSTYRTALGGKFYFGNGNAGGINVKHFTNTRGALEGTVLFYNHALGIEGLYEWHSPVAGAPGLKWYVGGGALIAFSTRDDYYNDDDETLFGIRGTLGLDYKFTGAPVNVAFDVNPTFVLTPNSDFDFSAGLAFRFTL